MADVSKYGFLTQLSHVGRRTKREHGFVNPPLQRGSTVLTPTVAQRKALQAQRGAQVLTYGTGGSETHWALEDAISAIEGGTRTYVVGTGLAAVTVPLLVFLKSGDHCLMPDHVYGPARNFANSFSLNSDSPYGGSVQTACSDSGGRSRSQVKQSVW